MRIYALTPLPTLIEMWITAYLRDWWTDMDDINEAYFKRVGEDIIPRNLNINFE